MAAPLKVGAIYTIGPYLFPALVKRLKNVQPDFRLLIQEDFTANLKTKLTKGEVDALILSLPFSDPGIETAPLYQEPLVVLMPAGTCFSESSNN